MKRSITLSAARVFAWLLLATLPLQALASGSQNPSAPNYVTAVNIRSTGAIGNDTLDDYPAINAAITAAVANGSNAIYVPGGSYLVSTCVSMPSNISIFGDGRGRSILKAYPNSNVNVLCNQNFGSTSVADSNITVRDLTIDGNKANQTNDLAKYGLACDPCQNLYIHNVEAHDVSGVGMKLAGGGLIIGPMQVSDIYVHDNSFNGLQIDHALRRSEVTNVTSELNGGYGVLFDASEISASNIWSRLNGNRVGGHNTEAAIDLRNITGGTFTNLTAENNYNDGIRVEGAVSIAGASWRAQNNGQKAANTQDDFSCQINPLPPGYGETTSFTLAGLVAGTNTQIADPVGTAGRERYAVNMGDVCNAGISLTGVMYTGATTANLRMPASPGANFSIQTAAPQRHFQELPSGTTSWTSPSDTTTVTIFHFILQGDGGGGGGCNTASVTARPGGGGATAEWTATGITPSTAYTTTVGAGGTAGAATPTDGGTGTGTSLVVGSVTITAAAGVGGIQCGSGNGVTAGGAASTAGSPTLTHLTNGQPGYTAVSNQSQAGSSLWGLGAVQAAAGIAGASGTGYGSGGGPGAGLAKAGAAGQPGFIRVEWIQ